MTDQKNNVCAVVVTYNRLDLLKKCLHAIHGQSYPVDALLVVNNGSSDGTADWLNAQQNLLVIHQDNLGGAGGFHRGIKEAAAAGFSWIWCMDDDVMPIHDALAAQMQIGVEHDLVLSYKMYLGKRVPLGNWFSSKSGKKMSRPITKEPQPVNFGHFEGMLISREVVEKIGLPDPRTFIWGEDILYGYEACEAGFSCVLPERPLFEKMLPEPDSRSSASALYFRTRNQILLLKGIRNAEGHPWFAYLHYVIYVVRQIVYSIFKSSEQRKRRLEIIKAAIVDAILNRWGKGSYFMIMAPRSQKHDVK